MPPEKEDIEEAIETAVEEAVEEIEETVEEAVEEAVEDIEEAVEEAVEAIEEAVEELQQEEKEEKAWQENLMELLDRTQAILTRQNETLERLESQMANSQTPKPSETDTSEMTTGTSFETPMDHHENDAVESVVETVQAETRKIIRL